MPSWARSPRAGPRGRRAPDCRGGRSPREPHVMPIGGLVCWPSAKATCQGTPLLERAVGICQDADLPVWFPLMAATLGAAYTLAGRVADAVPLLTQAMEQTIATERVGFRRSVVSPWGRRICWPATWKRPTPSPSGTGARPCAPGTRPPGVCPAPPRRHCGAARTSGERVSRGPLPPGPRPG